jgi:hypothetical protein
MPYKGLGLEDARPEANRKERLTIDLMDSKTISIYLAVVNLVCNLSGYVCNPTMSGLFVPTMARIAHIREIDTIPACNVNWCATPETIGYVNPHCFFSP